jgi:hypothetical protein
LKVAGFAAVMMSIPPTRALRGMERLVDKRFMKEEPNEATAIRGVGVAPLLLALLLEL